MAEADGESRSTSVNEVNQRGRGKHHADQRPAWLIGLLIAILIFVVVLVVAGLLGYGDDPAIGAAASPFA